jgi:transcriptional regulator of arginine metabolism
VPSATAEQRDQRRLAIARLLRENAIERQFELVELLRAAGYVATQSSVSRDLKDMGVVKVRNRYSMPDREFDGNGEPLRQIAEFVREIRTAGPNLLVVTTAIGAAQRVALTLDRTHWPEVVGTLSGDDTIFIATASAANQRRLVTRLNQSLKGISE